MSNIQSVPKLLRAIARGEQAKENKHDLIFDSAAGLIDRIALALSFADRYGGIDGDHHRAWVIDQMVRALSGGEGSYRDQLPKTREYEDWVKAHKDGSDGPDTYDWYEGIEP